ncbi:hypothetical protein BH11PSE11_BH11PSE11_17780 [soil metagenome]
MAKDKGPLSVPEYEQARKRNAWLPPPTMPPPTREAYQAFLAAQKNDSRYLALARDERDRFCEEVMRDGKAGKLAEIVSTGVLVLVGEQTKRKSANIIRKALALPCKAVYAIDPIADNLPSGESFVNFDGFVIELSDLVEDRRSTFRTISAWVRGQGFDDSNDIGQRLEFFSIK